MQRVEDEERHVEVKLSDDATDDTREEEGQAGGSPTFMPAPQHQSWRNICYLALGVLLIFVIGKLSVSPSFSVCILHDKCVQ